MERISLEEAENRSIYVRTPLSAHPDFYTIEEDEGGWEIVTYYTKNHRSKSGEEEGNSYVYILENESHPGMVKIGWTEKTPEERARTISRSTGVPTPFHVVFSTKVWSKEIEKRTHDYLKKYRVNKDREFFEIETSKAISAVKKIKEKYG